jgi:hypothetical protein
MTSIDNRRTVVLLNGSIYVIESGEVPMIAPTTFTAGDTTPSVKNTFRFKTANTAATTIVDFDDAAEGQQISVFFGDANTTIQHTASQLELPGSVDANPGLYGVMEFVHHSGIWYGWQSRIA